MFEAVINRRHIDVLLCSRLVRSMSMIGLELGQSRVQFVDETAEWLAAKSCSQVACCFHLFEQFVERKQQPRFEYRNLHPQ